MGFIGSILGTGDQGLNYKAASANLQQAATPEQATQLYNRAQGGLDQQQAFVNALQAQNGIGNQSSVFNQQQGLANQLQGVANGTGPNPAQQALANATGANVANQAAMLAGQRGASQNVGLMARQAAQQGAGIQQQAAGQGALMQAQQQLSAMNQLGQQQANMAGVAGQQVGQQAGALNNYNQATQNEQQNILNSIAAYNNAQVGNVSSQNSANAAIAGKAAQGQLGLMGALGGAGMGLIGGGGSAPAATTGKITGDVSGGQNIDSSLNQSMAQYAAHGGMIHGYADGGQVSQMQPANDWQPDASKSSFYQALQGNNNSALDSSSAFLNQPQAPAPQSQGGGNQLAQLAQLAPLLLAKGGKVPAMVSPGEVYLPPQEAKKVAQGKADPIKDGKKVPGKAKVKGDSLKNDTVPANLEVGGVVIPKSVLESKTPHKDAYKFVNAVINKHRMGKK